jgi:hypothetical protein
LFPDVEEEDVVRKVLGTAAILWIITILGVSQVGALCTKCKNDDNCTRGNPGDPGHCGSAITSCHDVGDGECASCSCTTLGGCACTCVPSKQVCQTGTKIDLGDLLHRFDAANFKPFGFTQIATVSGWSISNSMTNPIECTEYWEAVSFGDLLTDLADCWGGCVEIDEVNETIEFRDSGCY